MNKPFRVDSEGSVRDSQCAIVGRIAAVDPEVRSTLILRANLFDDMLRALELTQMYPGVMPPMATADVNATLAIARTVG